MSKISKTVPRNKFTQKTLWREVAMAARFAVVGIIATVVHLLVAFFLLFITQLPVLLVSALAFLTTFGISFAGNYIWTFRSPGAPNRAIRRFLIISFSAFSGNTIILVALLEADFLSRYQAVGLSVVVVPVITFWLSRVWAFQR